MEGSEGGMESRMFLQVGLAHPLSPSPPACALLCSQTTPRAATATVLNKRYLLSHLPSKYSKTPGMMTFMSLPQLLRSIRLASAFCSLPFMLLLQIASSSSVVTSNRS